jgi:hypothetical protein
LRALRVAVSVALIEAARQGGLARRGREAVQEDMKK